MADAAVQKPVGDTPRTPKSTAKSAARSGVKSVKNTPKKSTPKKVTSQSKPELSVDDQAGQESMTNGVSEKASSAVNGVQEDEQQVGDTGTEGAEDKSTEQLDEGTEDDAEENAQEDAEDRVEEAASTAQHQTEGTATHDEPEGTQNDDPEATQNEDETAEGEGETAKDEGETGLGEDQAAHDKSEAAQPEGQDAEDSGEDAIAVGQVNDKGEIVDDDGNVIGQVSEGDASKMAGSIVDQQGDILDNEGNVIGKAKPNAESAAEQEDDAPDGQAQDQAEGALDDAKDKAQAAEDQAPKPSFEGQLKANDKGQIVDATGKVIATLSDDDAKNLQNKDINDIDAEGNLLGGDGTILGKANLAEQSGEEKVEDAKPEGGELDEAKDDVAATGEQDSPEEAAGVDGQEKPDGAAEGEEEQAEPLDYTILKGRKVNKAGNVVDENGEVIGRLVEGDIKDVAGRACDDQGQIWNDSGKILGKAEPLSEDERRPNESKPFEDFPDATVERSGDVTYDGRKIGKVVEGDLKQCEGKKVDADGDISDKNGNVIGRAERLEDEPEEEEQQIDYSILNGLKVNKSGNVINDKGTIVGHVVEGDLKRLVGRTCDAEGKLWNDSGKQIGRAEPLPEEERDEASESPFEDFPDATVQKNGDVVSDGQVVGKVTEGDPKKLAGKKVDPEGDIVDKNGTVIGKAERYEEPEPEEEEKPDLSPLAGKRVNKLGNVVDEHGSIFGRLVEGDPNKLAGKMCDKEGNVWDEGGNVVGRAELVPESERSGAKDGPFTAFQPCHVTKEGKVVDSNGNVVGRLLEGEAKTLQGREVDPDGEILDKNGNSIGKAERWEEPEEERYHHPCSGLKVNKDGNVVSSEGDVIAKLTEGELTHCKGMKIDDDGDVVDGKGNSVGHVTLLEDIKEEEPEQEPEGPSQEELDAEKQKEDDKKLAKRMSGVIQDTLDKMHPILKDITDYIDQANNTPKDELDEQQLVDNVKPLIEKGGSILQETNGAIRGMDPDGRIQSQAKQNVASGEASSEEHHLAELLKELTSGVQDTIDKAKKKIAGMPHAEKEISPLWGLLQEPLFQILAAVGLLLNGVLGLVGKLLGGLGLGGLIDNLLGSLGLNKVLDSLGLGGVLGSVTGKK